MSNHGKFQHPKVAQRWRKQAKSGKLKKFRHIFEYSMKDVYPEVKIFEGIVHI